VHGLRSGVRLGTVPTPGGGAAGAPPAPPRASFELRSPLRRSEGEARLWTDGAAGGLIGLWTPTGVWELRRPAAADEAETVAAAAGLSRVNLGISGAGAGRLAGSSQSSAFCASGVATARGSRGSHAPLGGHPAAPTEPAARAARLRCAASLCRAWGRSLRTRCGKHALRSFAFAASRGRLRGQTPDGSSRLRRALSEVVPHLQSPALPLALLPPRLARRPAVRDALRAHLRPGENSRNVGNSEDPTNTSASARSALEAFRACTPLAQALVPTLEAMLALAGPTTSEDAASADGLAKSSGAASTTPAAARAARAATARVEAAIANFECRTGGGAKFEVRPAPSAAGGRAAEFTFRGSARAPVRRAPPPLCATFDATEALLDAAERLAGVSGLRAAGRGRGAPGGSPRAGRGAPGGSPRAPRLVPSARLLAECGNLGGGGVGLFDLLCRLYFELCPSAVWGFVRGVAAAADREGLNPGAHAELAARALGCLPTPPAAPSAMNRDARASYARLLAAAGRPDDAVGLLLAAGDDAVAVAVARASLIRAGRAGSIEAPTAGAAAAPPASGAPSRRPAAGPTAAGPTAAGLAAAAAETRGPGIPDSTAGAGASRGGGPSPAALRPDASGLDLGAATGAFRALVERAARSEASGADAAFAEAAALRPRGLCPARACAIARAALDAARSESVVINGEHIRVQALSPKSRRRHARRARRRERRAAARAARTRTATTSGSGRAPGPSFSGPDAMGARAGAGGGALPSRGAARRPSAYLADAARGEITVAALRGLWDNAGPAE
jgi:hypothetical protein